MGDAETRQEQLARNLNELLQELRVAQAGVQILFGFLLSIAFTERYLQVGTYIRVTHLVAVLLAAGAVALLTAPAAWHRILFRQGKREELIDVADRLAIGGMVCLALAMTATILLVCEMVVGGVVAAILGAVAGLGFATLWFVLPLRARMRARQTEDSRPE